MVSARGLACEGQPSSEHFVKDYSQTPDVRTGVDGQSACLLRRHVRRGADHSSRFGFDQILFHGVRLGVLGDAKVEHFDETVGADHHIFWFDVAMNYPSLMGCSKGTGYLNGNLQRCCKWKLTMAQAGAQSEAVNKLGGDEILSLKVSYFIDCEDVWVVQCRGRQGFLSKAPDWFVAGNPVVGKQFHCHLAVQPLVVCQVNAAHAAGAE